MPEGYYHTTKAQCLPWELATYEAFGAAWNPQDLGAVGGHCRHCIACRQQDSEGHLATLWKHIEEDCVEGFVSQAKPYVPGTCPTYTR